MAQFRMTNTSIALLVALSAMMGYAVVNSANKEVGKEVSIASAVINSALNGFFHALPVLKTPAPANHAERALLGFYSLIAIAATGYIYASTETAMTESFSAHPAISTPVSFLAQLSYFVPIACICFLLTKGSISAEAKPVEALEAVPAPKGDVETGLTESLLVDSKSETASSAGALTVASKTKSTAERARDLAVIAVSMVCGVGMLMIAAEAAYAHFKDKTPGSFMDRIYGPMYGTHKGLTYALHVPLYLLAVMPNIEGFYAIAATLKDLVQKLSAEKFILALLVLGVVGFSTLGTDMISQVGGVSIAPLALGLATAALGNYVPAIKFVQMLTATLKASVYGLSAVGHDSLAVCATSETRESRIARASAAREAASAEVQTTVAALFEATPTTSFLLGARGAETSAPAPAREGLGAWVFGILTAPFLACCGRRSPAAGTAPGATAIQ